MRKEQGETRRHTVNDRTDFTQGAIVSKLVFFMLPILGSLLLQAMYGSVDALIVGRFGTTAGLSGISTGSNVISVLTFIINGLATGVTVLIGRYLGEKQPEKIGPLLGAAIALYAAIAIGLCFLLVVFARPIAILMQSPEEALLLTIQYLRICGVGIFFIVAYNVISAVFRGLGDSRTPLLFVFIACCVNVALDLIFVAGLRMNVAGAALATVIAQACSVFFCLLVVVRRKDFSFQIRREDICFNSETKQIVALGAPLALQEFLTQMSFLALVAFINRLGLDASSGYGIASKLFSFILLFPMALVQSMSSFVSQNVGAGDERRAKRAMVSGMVLGVSVGTAVCLLITFFGGTISSLFTTDAAVIEKSWDYLIGAAPETIVTGILFCFMGYFNGHRKTMFVMLQGLIQTFAVRLPLSFYMSIQPDASLTKIGLATPIATSFGILINLIYFIIYNRKMKRIACKT